jgi:hypothetical protein
MESSCVTVFTTVLLYFVYKSCESTFTISGQGKADEGDKHGIQLPACSDVHLLQEHTKFLKLCKMSVFFVCKTNKTN